MNFKTYVFAVLIDMPNTNIFLLLRQKKIWHSMIRGFLIVRVEISLFIPAINHKYTELHFENIRLSKDVTCKSQV